MTAAAWAFAGIKILSSVGGAAGIAAAGAPAAAGASGLMGRLARLGGKVLAPLAIWQAANDAPLVQVERGDAAARARLQSGQDNDSMSRLRDLKASSPGLLDAWDEVKSWWSAPTNISLPQTANGYPVPPFVQNQQPLQPINITTTLQLDGRVIAETMNEVNGQSAARGPQGGPH
ncbi:hypothetical protein [Erwinia sp. V71]|uniref:hypothetical protein n=1 Tax=Erwinia sp. V71 TaxID=3369424 RepID=UPI003F5EBB9E